MDRPPTTYAEAMNRRAIMERAEKEYYEKATSCPHDGCLSNGMTFGEMAIYLLHKDDAEPQRVALERSLAAKEGVQSLASEENSM